MTTISPSPATLAAMQRARRVTRVGTRAIPPALFSFCAVTMVLLPAAWALVARL